MTIRERFITYANTFYEIQKLSTKNTLYSNVLDSIEDKLSSETDLTEVDLSNLDPYPDIFNTDEFPTTDPNVDAQEASLNAILTENEPYLVNFFSHFETQRVHISLNDGVTAIISYESDEVVVTIDMP